MHQNASLKSLIPIGSRWLPLVPFPLLFVPPHRQLQEEAPPARRAVCFSLVSQNLRIDALCRPLQIGTNIGASLNNPKVAATMAKGQSAVGSSAEDLHGRPDNPGHLDAPEHLQAGENAGVLMDCSWARSAGEWDPCRCRALWISLDGRSG